MAMFDNLKQGRSITNYNLFHGTTDFTELRQFDYYEQGFPLLVVVDIPIFMKKLCRRSGNDKIKNLINNYTHILEYEFTGLQSGLEAMNAQTGDITNGMQTLNVITKVEAQSASTFSMSYKERSGSILTRAQELYLRCVRDPNTGLKHYGGIIDTRTSSTDTTISVNDVGFDKECFTFLYMHTDNTGLGLERAALLCGCMPTGADLGIYNGTRGDISFQDITVEFSGIPVMGDVIDSCAKDILNYMNNSLNGTISRITADSWNYKYFSTQKSGSDLGFNTLHDLKESIDINNSGIISTDPSTKEGASTKDTSIMPKNHI